MAVELHLGDPDMEENHVGPDLVWGFKTWREEPDAVPQYIMEIQYRLDGVEAPIYVREKVVGDPSAATEELNVLPTLLRRLIPFLVDADYRREMYDRIVAGDTSFSEYQRPVTA